MRARWGLAAGMLLAGLLAVFPARLLAQGPPPRDDKDISGTYSFVRPGETLQINLQEGRVDGWVSRYVSQEGEGESDKDSFIDQFFEKATLDGDKLAFKTKTVHGVWYEFAGTVGRGPGKARSEDAYFVIKGKLKEYTTDADQHTHAREREVEFKSFPEDAR